MRVEVAVLNFPFLISLMVSVDVKQSNTESILFIFCYRFSFWACKSCWSVSTLPVKSKKKKKKAGSDVFNIFATHVPALFIASQIQIAEHKMAAFTVV